MAAQRHIDHVSTRDYVPLGYEESHSRRYCGSSSAYGNYESFSIGNEHGCSTFFWQDGTDLSPLLEMPTCHPLVGSLLSTKVVDRLTHQCDSIQTAANRRYFGLQEQFVRVSCVSSR
jgi:hypothetical protein